MFASTLLIVLLFAASVPAVSPLACNLKALNPAERAHHSVLSKKLSAAAMEKHETPDGIAFRLSLAGITLPELGEWIDAERKCCPFLDFQVLLEREGGSLQLTLTGRPGVKEFLLADFAKMGPQK
jgi:hypothetical protein